jgi:hypothetical protein
MTHSRGRTGQREIASKTQFYEWKDFRKSLNDLWKHGGRHQKAADRINAFIGRLGSGEDPFHGFTETKSGESRIPNCIKYDLNDHCRLVTVQTDGCCILLFAGSHEVANKWVASHRGFVPVIQSGNRIIVTYCSSSSTPDQSVAAGNGHFDGPLFERLPEHLFNSLVEGLPRRVARRLEALESGVTDVDLWNSVSDIEDSERGLAVHDVFALLRNDKTVEAVARLQMLTGEIVPLATVEQEILPRIVDSAVIRRIHPTSPIYKEALKRFMMTARYRDWMVFMHPDQEKVAQEDFDGPAKLVGVSGSGKTCVIVQRAIRLAAKYPKGTVLVLTLNHALAGLIDELISACAPEEDRARIEVKPFFVLCRELLLLFEPSALDPEGTRRFHEVTWKTTEHVDEVWQEYYRCEANNYDARVFQEVHDSLLARSWNPERYIREELDWLRSALKRSERQKYLQIIRKGRTVPLTVGLRERVLEGMAGWDDKMFQCGLIDALGIAESLGEYIPQILPNYRCVLVDEAQDFGQVEFKIVRALVAPADNDLFLCGDAAQAVTFKLQRLGDAGISVSGARSRQLALNYRNSRDVLAAAYEVFLQNMMDENVDREDFDVMDPVFSAYSGSTPLILSATNLETELRGAFAAARETLAQNVDAKVCIAICGYSLFELTMYGKEISTHVLDGSTSIESGSLFISDLEQTKGFEFDLVCVVNCSAGVLPDHAAPNEERHRDLARLYVAMTRAKTDLILSYSGEPSPFLANVTQTFLREPWEEYIQLGSTPSVGIPKRLEMFRYGSGERPWRAMSGEEFLFSERALGTSVELSSKLRVLVDGKGLKKGQQTLKWRTLGDAALAFGQEPYSRRQWGPEGGRQFANLISSLETRSEK